MIDETEKRLERRMEAQSTDLKEHINLVTEPILFQVTKTNGRVGVLEKIVWMAAGSVVILAPFTYYVATKIVNLQETARMEARQAVEDFIEKTK